MFPGKQRAGGESRADAGTRARGLICGSPFGDRPFAATKTTIKFHRDPVAPATVAQVQHWLESG